MIWIAGAISGLMVYIGLVGSTEMDWWFAVCFSVAVNLLFNALADIAERIEES